MFAAIYLVLVSRIPHFLASSVGNQTFPLYREVETLTAEKRRLWLDAVRSTF
jgi:hypothetical protein